MNKLDLQIIGSLQIKRFTFRSENPLEEVWARISQLGSPEFMLYKIHRNSKNNNWFAGLESHEMMLVGLAAILAIIGLVLMFLNVL